MDYISKKGHPLRRPQVQVFRDIAAHVDSGHNYGYIKRPTGTGKTITYLAEIAALDMPTLVLTPRTNLVTQTRESSELDIFDFEPGQIGVYYHDISNAKKMAGLKSQVLITTYGSYISLVKSGRLNPNDRPIVILDEVHHARGDVIRPMLQELFGNIYVQGWTATDTFITGQTIGGYVFRGVPPIHVTSIPQAVSQKEITPYKNIIVETHIDTKIKVVGGRDFNSSELETITRKAGRNKAAIDKFLNFQDEETGLRLRDMKSIWYCAGVDHSEEIAEMLTDIFGENRALAVSGETPKRDLEKILRMHREGKLPILVNADLLIEGFDSPSTQLAMMLRPTRSPIIAEQTGGRILRRDPHNPNKIGYIVTFVDEGMYDIVPFGVVAEKMLVVPKGYEYRLASPDISRDARESKELPRVTKVDVRSSKLDLEDFVRRRNEYNFTLKPKPDDFISKWQWERVLSVPGETLRRAFDWIIPEYEALGISDEPLVLHGISIPKNHMGFFRVQNKSIFCVHKGEAEVLRRFMSTDYAEMILSGMDEADLV